MRAFIILGFMLAAASAAKLGYNYGPGVSGTRQVVSGGNLIGTGYSGGGSSGGIIGGGGIVGGGRLIGSSNKVLSSGGLIGGGGLVGGGLVGGGQVGGGLVGGGLVGGGLIGGGLVGGSGNLGGSAVLSSYGSHSSNLGNIGGISGGYQSGAGIGVNALDSVPQTVEYNKQVYYFSAPDEVQNEGQTQQQLTNILKKNLQIVFIKAPENNAATNAALQLAKQAIEQRTAIYLLSKENDASQVVGQLQQIQEGVQVAPEVRIVKYRTPQDLAYARENIQAQYNNYGGSGEIINGGVVPVLNYASPAAAGSGNLIGGGKYSTTGGSYVSNVGSSLGGGSLISGGGIGGSGLVSGLGIGQSLGGSKYVSGGSVLGGSTLGGSIVGGRGSTVLSGSSLGGTKYVSGIGGGVSSAEYLPPNRLRK